MKQFFLIILAIFLAGCGRRSPEGANATRTLFVSIAPQQEAVQRIAGDGWEVRVLVPPGASPETYSPNAVTLNRLAAARALFTLNVPMEATLLPKVRALNANLAVIDGTQGMAVEDFRDDEGEGVDPHVWLSPANMAAFATTVGESLAQMEPENAERHRRQAAAYRSELEALDMRIAQRLAPLKGRPLFVYHPAFGYFARHYGLKQLSIEREGKEPTGGYLAAVLAAARTDKTPALFLQPQFNPKPAQTLAREIPCRLVPLDPLPKSYLIDMQILVDTIAEAYGLSGEEAP